MKKLIATFFLVISSLFTVAQIPFDKVNGPPGGKVIRLATNNAATVSYALVSENNDGSTWTPSTFTGLPTAGFLLCK